ncbi:hypothetical protein [Amycolatopsis sp. NPDC051071]|uniref:DUF7507 domain-containing protein n=1 Tax=Amycolatopsis sp. NPDC051071 TaxID=3154637 RepID=UPI0034218331
MSRYSVAVFLLLLVAIPLLAIGRDEPAGPAPVEQVAQENADALSPAVKPSYRDSVYGDVLMAGNSVLRCPVGDEVAGDNPPAGCAAATRNRNPGGGVLLENSGNNNGYYVHQAKDDGRVDSFNSSSAELKIPPGAKVRHAQLNWGGHTGTFLGFSGVNCVRPILLQGEAPPLPAAAEPAGQAPRIAVDGGKPRPVDLTPEHFTTTDGLTEASRIYTDWADVTAAFDGASTDGPLKLSVSNVWAPSGPGCAGGWSIVLVFDYGEPVAPYLSPRVIDIYTEDLPRSAALLPGLLEPLLPGALPRLIGGPLNAVAGLLPGLAPSLTGTSVTLPGVSPKRSTADVAIGLTGFDGDWRQGEENFVVDGVAMAEPCSGDASAADFFRSCATGAVDPLAPAERTTNNLSVDVKTVKPALTDNEDGSIEVGVNSVGDFVVLQSLVLAETVAPAVSLTMTGPASPVAQGDMATFALRIRNEGALRLTDLDLDLVTRNDGNADTEDDGIRCAPPVLRALEPGASTDVTCLQPARVVPGFTTEASVAGTYLAGTTGKQNTVRAAASAAVQVTPVDYAVERLPDRLVVREGADVTFAVRLLNNTATDLTQVTYTDSAASGCSAPAPTLSAGKPVEFLCVATAPAASFTSSGRMTGVGEQGGVTVDGQPVLVTVIHPAITVATKVDKDVLYLGDTVELTFEVRNAGDEPDEALTKALASVADLCAAPPIPALDPGGSANVTCVARPSRAGKVPIEATVTAADVNGDPVTGTAAPVTITVLEPLITLTQAADPSTVRVGGQTTLTFTVRHTGTAEDGPVANVAVASPTLPDCKPKPIPELAPGQSATVECPATPDRSFDNQATASAVDKASREMRVGTPPLRVTVINPAIAIATTADPAEAKHGQHVDFSVTVRNIGDVPLTVEVRNDRARDCDFTLSGEALLRIGAAHGVRCTFTVPAEESVTELTNTASFTATPLAGSADTGEPLTGLDAATVTVAPGKAPPSTPSTGNTTAPNAGTDNGVARNVGGTVETPGRGAKPANGPGTPGNRGKLPNTGASPAVAIGMGVSLLLLGTLTLAATSRRRRDENSMLHRWWPGD